MNKVNLDNIIPEMKIAQTITIPFTDITLVETGTLLNEPAVLLLKSMGVNEVMVFDENELRAMAQEAEADNDKSEKVRKILIVDDEKEICNYISEVVASQGYKPKVSLSAADAWNKLVCDPSINDIFLDILMPEMNGIEFLNKIRTELGRNVNVVMVTAKKSIEDVVVAKKLGIIDYIMKPFTPDRIIKALQMAPDKTAKPLSAQQQ